MDLEYKPPQYESFYSSKRRQVSPTWTEKDKVEEDPDTAINSDGEDQSSPQGNDVESNSGDMVACDGGLNNALVWKDGIGTLLGSDLKFRMNPDGYIEMILDDKNDSSAISNSLEKAHDQVSSVATNCDVDSAQESETHLRFDPESANSDCKAQQHALPHHWETMTGVKNEPHDIASGNSNQALADNFESDCDAVLKDDLEASLYADGIPHAEGCIDSISPASDLKVSDDLSGVVRNSGKKDGPACEICGQLAPRGTRFCSRQCVGRHAAFKRLAVNFAANKKAKAGRKRSVGRPRNDEQYFPNSKDVLTVVHDDSCGERSDLKIKIRWSSSVNENQDTDYAQTDRENGKGKAAWNSNSTKGKRKVFTWPSYLLQENAESVPISAFENLIRKDPYPGSNRFRVGMSLEGVDPENEALICPLYIAEVHGFRIRLRFYGYSETHDFWKNADCPLIFPCGFCEKTGRTLRHPNENGPRHFDWGVFGNSKEYVPAPKEYFATTEDTRSEHEFKVGQKLEAVDKHNPTLVCVASVSDVIGDRVLISFDGWSDQFNFWCDARSQLLHRVGWCQDHGAHLNIPRGWDESSKFDWGTFLESCNSRAVSSSAFAGELKHDFAEGMKLEAVDPKNKILVRAATIVEIRGFQVKIHFDGWSEMYDFWTFLDDPDLHPIRWCERTGHRFEPPIGTDAYSDEACQNSGCPIEGCPGIGHIKGPKFNNHYSEFGCPYSMRNLDKEHIKNRLSTVKYKRRVSSDEVTGNIVVEQYTRPVSRVGRPPKRKRPAAVMRFDSKKNKCNFENANEFTEFGGPALRNVDIVSKWTVCEVSKFVEEVTNEALYGEMFRRQEMDGRALLMLTQAEILTIMRIKLGPAVKIYHAILNIKADS